jgi:E3 ubiquitin-protein ligase SHPRH
LLAFSGEPECPRSPYPKEIEEKSERWFFLKLHGLTACPKRNSKTMTCNIPPYKRTFSTHFSLSSLQIVQRSRETTVQVIALPEGGYDPAEDLPFRLHAQLKMMN